MEEMTLVRALELLRGGEAGVREWNGYRDDENRHGLVPALYGVDLREAHLGEVNLAVTDLGGADLRDTDLRNSDLRSTNLGGADLAGANMRRANLVEANLRGANLNRADLHGARAAGTKFGHSLSMAKGLEEIRHYGPSMLGQDVLRALGKGCPEKFLRGCGLAPWEALSVKLHDPDLSPEEVVDLQTRIFALRTDNPIQVRPVFMSYSHDDSVFVDRVEASLYNSGINVYRDVHHTTAGPLEEQVHDAMKHRLVLVVLSEASTSSDWVEHEVEKAREIAKEQDRHVLSPIALDESWKTCNWPERLRGQVEKFNVLDFSGWQDDDTFNERFRRLAAGIRKWY